MSLVSLFVPLSELTSSVPIALFRRKVLPETPSAEFRGDYYGRSRK